jgi:hypothetical protein
MTTVISTFSIDGYELYGHQMIKTWLNFWPSDCKLIIYTEGYKLTEKDIRLTEIDINDACPDLLIFKEKSRDLIKDHNNKKLINRISKTIKWCHKVYAMKHALENCQTDNLIFLDGDTYTKNHVSSSLAKDLVASHLFSVHFEKLKHGLHFETGLISFNMHHPQMTLLKNNMLKDYNTLDIYNHEKTWDGYWFAYLYKKFNLDVLDLSNGKMAGVFSNPLVTKILVHEAGNAKYKNSGYNYNRYSGRKV